MVVRNEIKYTGQTGRNNLFRRFRGYEDPASSKKRKSNPFLVLDELKQGRDVESWLLSEEKLIEERFNVSSYTADTVVADRLLMERFLISWIRPLWNKKVPD